MCPLSCSCTKYNTFRCLKDYRSGMGAICPNQQSCGAVSACELIMPDQHALDVEARMEQFAQDKLNNSWRRLIKKVQDQHQRIPSLRKLSSKQRKRFNQKRTIQYQKYSKKFSDIYCEFPENCKPYAPSQTAHMPKQVTCSYGLYNNINFCPKTLTPDNIAYMLGHRQEPEYMVHPKVLTYDEITEY
jgi:hypothetical protein